MIVKKAGGGPLPAGKQKPKQKKYPMDPCSETGCDCVCHAHKNWNTV